MADAEVLRIFDELKELHEAKDHDYSSNEPLSNFRRCESFGIPAWKGCLVRMSDKWSRLVSLVGKDGKHAVVGESIEDTLQDLAVYSIIALALLRKQRDQHPVDEISVKGKIVKLQCDCDIPNQAEIAQLRIDDDKRLPFHDAVMGKDASNTVRIGTVTG